MKKQRSAPMEKFINERRDWEEKDIQLAQTYYLQQILDRTERTRSNTSTLVLVFVVLPIVLFVLILLMG